MGLPIISAGIKRKRKNKETIITSKQQQLESGQFKQSFQHYYLSKTNLSTYKTNI